MLVNQVTGNVVIYYQLKSFATKAKVKDICAFARYTERAVRCRAIKRWSLILNNLVKFLVLFLKKLTEGVVLKVVVGSSVVVVSRVVVVMVVVVAKQNPKFLTV